MDLSPTDLRLVSYDLYKTDEKYNFKLTDILRRRNRPILLIVDQSGEPVYKCRADGTPPDDRFAPVITSELIADALDEARHLMASESEPMGHAARQIMINKPDEKCALIVLANQFWCLRIFELQDAGNGSDKTYAVLVEPIGDPHSGNLDLQKIKGLFRLSNREADVVEELVFGRPDKEIAQRLGISVETVRAYLKSVRAKLGVSTRTAIVSVVHDLRGDKSPPP